MSKQRLHVSVMLWLRYVLNTYFSVWAMAVLFDIWYIHRYYKHSRTGPQYINTYTHIL